jgi:hypothetical protein
VVAGVQPDDEVRSERRIENQCGTGKASGKVFIGGAHRTGVVALRRRRCFGPAALRR